MKRDKGLGIALLLPMVIVLAVFGIFPVYKVIEFSFFKQQIFSTDRVFVGLENIINILSKSEFWISLKNSIIYTVGAVGLELIIGLLLALFLNIKFPGRNIVRSLILFSYLVPVIVVVVVWRFMLNDSTGIINYFIRELNIPISTTWFSDPDTSMISVIMVSVWKYFPFMIIMFLAQLQSISKELYEAARVDGATIWHEFRYITLPLLKPVIIVALMLRTIFTFKHFSIVYLLTGGGPINSTMVLPIYMYQKTFNDYSLGKGSAIALIMFLIILLMSIFYLRIYNRSQVD